MKTYTFVIAILMIFLIRDQVQCKLKPNPKEFLIQKQEMLKLMNEVRSQLKKALPSLQLDDELIQMASAHSKDMVINNYFSHINKNNQGPEQRGKKVNFIDRLGENIAIGQNIKQIHQSLMNSAPHYLNTINPEWTRCGIGFYRRSRNQMYATILFSSRDCKKYPVSSQQLKKVQISTAQYLISTDYQLKQDKELSQHIKKFFQVQSLFGNNIFNYLKAKYPKNNFSYLYTTANVQWTSNLVDTLRNGGMLIKKDNNHKKFGVNMKMNGSRVQIMVVYSK